MCEFPILIPNALHDMVQDFITSALCERPENYIDYAVEYHKKLREGVKKGKPTRKRIEIRKRKLSPLRASESPCSVIARKQHLSDQSHSPHKNEYYRVSPPISQNTAAKSSSELYHLTSVGDQTSVPPGTILYRTCVTPPLYQSTNSAVVYLTDPAISQEVSSLVTPTDKSDRIKLSLVRTTPHHKLSISSPTLPPTSTHTVVTETYNGHPQLSQHFSYACSTIPEEGLICRCCGMVFRNLIDYNRHYSLHIVHASATDKMCLPTSQYSLSNTSMPPATSSIALFKCLECNILFKHFSSLRLHYYTHAQGSQ